MARGKSSGSGRYAKRTKSGSRVKKTKKTKKTKAKN